MLRKISLFSVLALFTAWSSRSCHATKLSECARTKGLLLCSARFLRGSGSDCTTADGWLAPLELFPDAGS